ncbi:MAG TPA: CdaR family protein, partial [Luteitalea sp.]|nr:CdaR family protein [Luteitalea sp.]
RVQDTVTVGVEDSTVRLREPLRATVVVEVVPAPVQSTLEGVNITSTNLARGLVARVTPAKVSVTVRGTRERVAGLDAGDLVAAVDLADLGAGRHVVAVQVPNREGVAVEKVEPANVTVTIR